MGININDLNPLGASLLADSESLMDNITSLSEDELKVSGGGHHDYYKDYKGGHHGYSYKDGHGNNININIGGGFGGFVPVPFPVGVGGGGYGSSS